MDESDGWYYAVGAERFGPVAEGEVRRQLELGRLSPSDLVWKSPMPDWQPAQSLPNFAGVGNLRPLAPAVYGGGSAAASTSANPYASPTPMYNPYDSASRTTAGGLPRSSLVRQVTGVSIALIVCGAIALLGLAFCLLVVFYGLTEGQNDPDFEDAEMVIGLYSIGAVSYGAAALLSLVAGIRGLGYRGWGMMLAALIVNIVTGMCCSLWGIGIGIWGLVVLLNPTVKEAFRLGTLGTSRDRIIEQLAE